MARALWTVLEGGEPVVTDVEFRGWTPAGELRHAVFKGRHWDEANKKMAGHGAIAAQHDRPDFALSRASD